MIKKAVNIIFLLLLTNIYSQRVNYKQFTVNDGLSQSQVFSLCLDKMNRVWVGTVGGGVNVFDGIKFTNYTTDNGLAGNYIFSLYRASNDNIIIGTEKGISVYDGKNITPYIDTINNYNLKIWDIVENINGEYILATSKGILKFKDGKYQKYKINKVIDNIQIFDIFISQNGTMWFGTKNNGIFTLKNKKIKHYTKKNGLPFNTVRTIIQDSLGNIWAGTDRKISKLGKNDNFITDHNLQTYTSSCLSNRNELFFVNNNGWFVKYSTTNKDTILVEKSIWFPINNFSCIIQDYENNFWIGTSNGLIKFNEDYIFLDYSDIIPNVKNKNVYALHFTNNNHLIFNYFQEASYDINIEPRSIKYSYNYEKYTYTKNNINKTIISSSIYSITEDKENNIWFGARAGLSIYNKKNKNFKNFTTDKEKQIYKSYTIINNFPNNAINNIMCYIDSSIYFATARGLGMYKNEKFYNLNDKFPELKDIFIIGLKPDNKNNIWGTMLTGGIFKISGYEITFFNEENKFINSKTNYIIQDKKGNYWIATSYGLYWFNEKEYKYYTKKDGIFSGNIYVLEIDYKNNLIIGSEKGIDILNLDKYYKGELKFKHYGKEDGFGGVECNRNAIYKDYRGHIWFGTVNGVYEYLPENDKPNTVEPNTFITKVLLNNSSENLIKYCDSLDINNLPVNIALPYNMKNFSIKFISTSRKILSKVKFQYKLAPLYNKWQEVKNGNEINFLFIPDGEYTLLVRSSNNDGIWDSTPAKLSFIVMPPIWKRTWFIISAIILGILLILFYIKRREAKLRKEKLILEEKVKERTKEIVRQKEIVELKNKDITDSINYARNIQRALLPTDEFNDERLKSSLIFFKPRDIVSGDFYWVKNRNNKTYITAADCTGHGVPGAFMSMLGMAFLDEIVNNDLNLNAAQILNKMRENVINSLKQRGKTGESRDGMDMALCVIDWETQKLHFAGANNPLYLISKDSKKTDLICNREQTILEPKMQSESGYNLFEIKADKMPIGYYIRTDNFKNHTLNLVKHDTMYMFSDGFADQFGGKKGRKFKYKKFKQLLLELENTDISKRHQEIEKAFINWYKGYEQIDDVIIIGLKFENI